LWGAGSFNFQRPFLVLKGFMDILLSTINSRYHHSSFGLRYLYANLGELQTRARICEFVLGKNPRDIAESLLAQNPKIIGLGVYIWNTTQILELVSVVKKLAPEVVVVLGGPEISYETENQELFKLADYVIQNHRGGASGNQQTSASLRLLHRRGYRSPSDVCRGVTRLSLQVRILP
jgi:hypothetical protein